VQNTKRSRDDVLEPVTIRDDISETTEELLEEMDEHDSKRARKEEECRG
jgi:hypothetical protein